MINIIIFAAFLVALGLILVIGFYALMYAWIAALYLIYIPAMTLLEWISPRLYEKWNKWLIKDV